MEISARGEYAIRALAELTQAGGGPLTVERAGGRPGHPRPLSANILLLLRQRSLVHSQRGAEGGYRLARPAATITLADILRAVDGPLAAVRGERPESVQYQGSARALGEAVVRLYARACAASSSTSRSKPWSTGRFPPT